MSRVPEIRKVAEIKEAKVRGQGKGKKEAQISAGIVEELFKAMGYSCSSGTMQREHNLVRNKKADILLIHNGRPVMLLEVKDLGSEIDNRDGIKLLKLHYNQLASYLTTNNIPFGILTNGFYFYLYSKASLRSNDYFSYLFSFTRESLANDETANKVADYFSIESMFDRSSKLLLKLERNVLQIIELNSLKAILREQTNKLTLFFRSYIDEQVKRRSDFRSKLLSWAKEHNYSVGERLYEQLSREGAFILVSRILFYRIMEDRDLLPKNAPRFRNAPEKISFDELKKVFSGTRINLDRIYRSPIFDSIEFKDVYWTNQMLRSTFAPLSEFNFEMIDNDILGKAYEEHLRGDRERNDMGQVYTPEQVREYMVNGALRFWRSSNRNGTIPHFGDIACGSGSFLLTAYKQLKEYNVSHKNLLEKYIFGNDINPFASQISMFNLVLCSPTPDQMNVLPNVHTGDSLLIPNVKSPNDAENYHEYYRSSQLKASQKIHAETFDVICTNPPYICFGFGDRRDLQPQWKKYYLKNYKAAEGTVPIQHLFFELTIRALKIGGVGALILNDKLLMGSQSSKIRKLILENCLIREIILFTNNVKCWGKDAEVGQPLIVIFEKANPERVREQQSQHMVDVKKCEGFNELPSKNFMKEFKIPQDWFYNPKESFRFHLVFDDLTLRRVKSERELGWSHISDFFIVHQGIYWTNGEDGNILATKPKKGVFAKGYRSSTCIAEMKLVGQMWYLNVDPNIIQKNKPSTYKSGHPKRSFSVPKVVLPRDGNVKAVFDDKGFFFNNNLLIAALSPKYRKQLDRMKLRETDKNDYERKALKMLTLILNSEEFERRYKFNTLYFDRLHPQVNCDVIKRQVVPDVFFDENVLKKAEVIHDRVVATSSRWDRKRLEIDDFINDLYTSSEKSLRKKFKDSQTGRSAEADTGGVRRSTKKISRAS